MNNSVYVVNFTSESGKKSVEVIADFFEMSSNFVVLRSRSHNSFNGSDVPPIAAYRQSDVENIQLKEIVQPTTSSPVSYVGE